MKSNGIKRNYSCSSKISSEMEHFFTNSYHKKLKKNKIPKAPDCVFCNKWSSARGKASKLFNACFTPISIYNLMVKIVFLQMQNILICKLIKPSISKKQKKRKTLYNYNRISPRNVIENRKNSANSIQNLNYPTQFRCFQRKENERLP